MQIITPMAPEYQPRTYERVFCNQPHLLPHRYELTKEPFVLQFNNFNKGGKVPLSPIE